MELHSIITEENPNPVLILSKFGRLVYANVPGMDVLDYFKIDIGQKIPKLIWMKALTSHVEGVFMLSIDDQNYRWKVKELQNGFTYLVAKKEAESNLMFSRD